jgi:hypothetical protein
MIHHDDAEGERLDIKKLPGELTTIGSTPGSRERETNSSVAWPSVFKADGRQRFEI